MELHSYVEWEDGCRSVISLRYVQYPRKDYELYKEGDTVTETYKQKDYRATLIKISGKLLIYLKFIFLL